MTVEENRQQLVLLLDSLNLMQRGECPNTETLIDLSSDMLPSYYRESCSGELEAHVDSCLSCRSYVDALCQGVASIGLLQQEAIIHRDLKPSNLMMTEGDAASLAKIIDFGLAKPVSFSSLEAGNDCSQAYAAATGSHGIELMIGRNFADPNLVLAPPYGDSTGPGDKIWVPVEYYGPLSTPVVYATYASGTRSPLLQLESAGHEQWTGRLAIHISPREAETMAANGSLFIHVAAKGESVT